MHRAFARGTVDRQTAARRLMLLVLILLVAVFLMAQITIIANARHECIGDGCPICKMIHGYEMLLKRMGSVVFAVSAMLVALLILLAGMNNRALTRAESSTLAYTKVRLNM